MVCGPPANHAVRRGMGQMTGSMNAELRTPPGIPGGLAVAELAVVGLANPPVTLSKS
jgi:hypothetical protein